MFSLSCRMFLGWVVVAVIALFLMWEQHRLCTAHYEGLVGQYRLTAQTIEKLINRIDYFERVRMDFQQSGPREGRPRSSGEDNGGGRTTPP
jgi:hypothetical protein